MAQEGKIARTIRFVLWALAVVLFGVLLGFFFKYLEGVYDFILDLAEIGVALSVAAVPFLLIRRLRSACASIWSWTALLNVCAGYLAAIMLYMNWNNGVFSFLAWVLTGGAWPLIYCALASFSHPGHQFLESVIAPFGIAFALTCVAKWAASSAVNGEFHGLR